MSIASVHHSLVDAICEKPIYFKTGSVRYALYPATLGVHLFASLLWQAMELDEQLLSLQPEAEALRLASQHRSTALRLVALHTLRKPRDIRDDAKVEAVATKLGAELSSEDLAQLLLLLLGDDGYQTLAQHYGIDRDKAECERVARIKGDSSMLHFGGKSLYGGIVDYALSRYGWTLDYCLWGISYLNLRMLADDATTSIYLSEDERKGLAHTRFNADDPDNQERIKELLQD